MKRILFVDDDTSVLDGLRARLYRRRQEWDMQFVATGSEAIAAMETQRADVIVSDMRMPGMDGGELLGIVKARWPETIRIIVSGYSESAQILQLVALAHQYASKPCDAKLIENMIERCLRLDQLLKHERLRAVVGRIGKLPAMPETYQRLQSTLAKPNVSGLDVARVIESDPLIAAKVLQVANSAFFRLAKPMTRVRDAVAYLGHICISNMVMSAEIFSQWHKLPILNGLEPNRLQAHAQTTAAACVALARGTPLADDALLAGLVHDIGYWVLLQECPKDLTAAMALARSTNLSWHEAELQVIGASHAEIGAYLLGLWGLPYPLIEAVAFHHSPQAVPQHGFDLLALLTTAHSLQPGGAENAPQLDSEMQAVVDRDYFESLDPPFDWQEALMRIENLQSNIVE